MIFVYGKTRVVCSWSNEESIENSDEFGIEAFILDVPASYDQIPVIELHIFKFKTDM